LGNPAKVTDALGYVTAMEYAGTGVLSQMVQAERVSGSYSLGAYFGLFNITDAPRFGTRGLMVDSARHWLPPNVLLSLMDALSYVKMNKLEVGFGIDWSYTLQSAAFPNLTDSSYGPKGTHLYSRATVQWLVAEANLRGIRLVPFVEVVGHNALCSATPDVCWCGGQPKGNLPHPLHNITWQFFDVFWGDLKQLFPEEYVNIGGDEVDASCFVGDPEIMVRGGGWGRAQGGLPRRGHTSTHAKHPPSFFTPRPGTLRAATAPMTLPSSWATTTSSRRCS
jgi:hexosaminidase